MRIVCVVQVVYLSTCLLFCCSARCVMPPMDEWMLGTVYVVTVRQNNSFHITHALGQ